MIVVDGDGFQIIVINKFWNCYLITIAYKHYIMLIGAGSKQRYYENNCLEQAPKTSTEQPKLYHY